MMKKLIFGLSVMVSGLLLACGALIAGAILVGSANIGSGSGVWGFGDYPITIVLVVIGSLLALCGLFLSAIEVFNKSNKQ